MSFECGGRSSFFGRDFWVLFIFGIGYFGDWRGFFLSRFRWGSCDVRSCLFFFALVGV